MREASRIIRGLEALREEHKGFAVTIGNFDGVHAGHQKIIERVAEIARKKGTKSMAITFDPHPLKVLAPDSSPKLITTTEEKARLLLRYGVDAVLFLSFSKEFSNIPPEEFIRDVLASRLEVKAVVVGHGYAFGKAKRGNTVMLRRCGRKYGYLMHVVRNAFLFGKPVSSSRVRNLIAKGKVTKAAQLLGRPFAIHGTVIAGAGRGGPVLKTPTANITTPTEIVPAEGVYAVRAVVGAMCVDGVANIGTNPTFKGKEMSYEVHLLDFQADLRGDQMEVQFIDRIRDEITFSSPEALRAQIKVDIAAARRILDNVKCE